LLNEIRLHGEDTELVQSVVNLSVRYGIITPYTSYLIEEDDIFSQMGRDDMAEEAMVEVTRVVTEVSGESAVDSASAANSMADAEVAPMAPMATAPAMAYDEDGAVVEQAIANQPIQFVGSKTFINRNGVWMDTAYNADTMTPQQVGFASDTYFDLLTASPEMGQYLAVGEEVLVVFGGNVYQVVAGEGDGDVDMPDPTVSNNTVVDEPDTTTDDPVVPRPNPIQIIESGNEEGGGAPYIGIFAVALILPLMVGLFIGRRQRKNASS
jgi:Ca-activated chloride channel family protein